MRRIRRRMKFMASSRLHYLGDDGRHPVPALLLGLELLPPGARERVILSPAIFLGQLPLRLDPALLLHPVKRGIERALVHLESALGELLEFERDSPPVQFAAAEHAQNQHVEGALEKLTFLGHGTSPRM